MFKLSYMIFLVLSLNIIYGTVRFPNPIFYIVNTFNLKFKLNEK